jgi:hypothetical protein
MTGPIFHSLSVCAGCGCTGDDFGSVNVEAFELTGELYCEECAYGAIDDAIEDMGEDEE